MSATQNLQSGFPLEMWQPFGAGKIAVTAAPSNGYVGAAPGCEWINLLTGITYKNVGTSASAFWVESDPFAGSGAVFGGTATPTSSAAIMLASGNIYRKILTVANGRSASATATDKIVDGFLIPANSFDATGRGIQVTAWATAAATANNKLIKVVLGATNASTIALDGTVTLTGGTTIGTTGTLTTNNGGVMLQCQLFKTGAANSNTQESMTTAIVGGGTHAGVGAWTDQTFTENTALFLVVVVNVATATTDIVYQGCEITGFN